jgi:hypothetical protein
MAKRKRRSRRKLPWPYLGSPIERILSLGFEGSADIARKQQHRRMLKLKKHYHIEGEDGDAWYRLAIAIVSEFDDGLKIVDQKQPDKKDWKGADGYVLVNMVEEVQRRYPERKRTARWCLNYLIKHSPHYRPFSLETLSVRHAEAKRHQAKRATNIFRVERRP